VTSNQGGSDGGRTDSGGPGPDAEPPTGGETQEPPDGGGGEGGGGEGGDGEQPACENEVDCVVEDVLGGGGIG
jgi:hypothetical protein